MNEIEEMRAFVQLVASGSATGAARARGVAVSAISRRLRELEERLGVQLVQRTTRRMTLTDEGRYFHLQASRILADIADAEAEVSKKRATLSGRIKLAAPAGFGASHLAAPLASFAASHPAILLDIDMTDRKVDLLEEGFDLALRIGALPSSSLIARQILTIRQIVVAAPGFFEKGPPERPSDLAGLPALAYGHAPQPHRWAYLGPSGEEGVVELQPRITATSGEALATFAAAGLGVASEPSFIVARPIEEGALRPFLLDYRWRDLTLHALYPPTRLAPSRARALVDFLIEHFGPEPEWERAIEQAGLAAACDDEISDVGG